MGRVYSPEDVTAGNVPEIGAHYEAGRFLLGELFDLDAAPHHPAKHGIIDTPIDSAMVYGSTATGNATRRSDLDVLVNYRNYGDELDAATILGEVIRETQTRYKVPIELNLFPAGVFYQTNMHSVDPLFAEHLVKIQAQTDPQWSYHWPADGLETAISYVNGDTDRQIPTRRLRALAQRYSAHLMNHVAKSLVSFDGTPDYNTFQRALELPSSLGRKVLAALDASSSGDTRTEPASNKGRVAFYDSLLKATVGMAEKDAYTCKNMPDMLVRLQSKDAEYSELLESRLSGGSTQADYEKWVRGEYRPACVLAYGLAERWANVIRLNLDTRDLAAERNTTSVRASAPARNGSYAGNQLSFDDMDTEDQTAEAIDDDEFFSGYCP